MTKEFDMKKITLKELKRIVAETIAETKTTHVRKVSLNEFRRIVKEAVDEETMKKRLGRELYKLDKLDRYVRSGGTLENGMDARRALKAVAHYLPRGSDALVGGVIDNVEQGDKLVAGDDLTVKYQRAIRSAREALQ